MPPDPPVPRIEPSASLLCAARWGSARIENKSPWVRDVTFDEVRSQVRSGAIPQVMAALRNTTIGLLRCTGVTNIAAACRHDAAQPWAALTLLGIDPRPK
jgi:hypothetical protein